MWPFSTRRRLLKIEPLVPWPRSPRVTIEIKLEGMTELRMKLRRIQWALLDLRREIARE